MKPVVETVQVESVPIAHAEQPNLCKIFPHGAENTTGIKPVANVSSHTKVEETLIQ